MLSVWIRLVVDVTVATSAAIPESYLQLSISHLNLGLHLSNIASDIEHHFEKRFVVMLAFPTFCDAIPPSYPFLALLFVCAAL